MLRYPLVLSSTQGLHCQDPPNPLQRTGFTQSGGLCIPNTPVCGMRPSHTKQPDHLQNRGFGPRRRRSCQLFTGFCTRRRKGWHKTLCFGGKHSPLWGARGVLVKQRPAENHPWMLTTSEPPIWGRQKGILPICSDLFLVANTPISSVLFRFVFRTNQGNPFLPTPFASPRRMPGTPASKIPQSIDSEPRNL